MAAPTVDYKSLDTNVLLLMLEDHLKRAKDGITTNNTYAYKQIEEAERVVRHIVIKRSV